MSFDSSTIAATTAAGPQAAGQRFYGKYRGRVTKNNDPRNQGRIRAKVPEVLGDTETGWALPCAPYAGKGSGAFTVPEPKTGVWIEFEAGDVSRPIWSGCWWSQSKVPEDNAGTLATPPVKVIRSEKGLMVTFDDSRQTIHVSDENGANMLEIQVQAGKITIKGASKAVVEAPLIELVENATHPVVFGDQLLTYLAQFVAAFNQHLHPGETLVKPEIPVNPKPPQPMVPPPTPVLVSKRVKSG